VWRCFCDPAFSRFSRTPTCDRRTDGQTDTRRQLIPALVSITWVKTIYSGLNKVTSKSFMATQLQNASHYLIHCQFPLVYAREDLLSDTKENTKRRSPLLTVAQPHFPDFSPSFSTTRSHATSSESMATISVGFTPPRPKSKSVTELN